MKFKIIQSIKKGRKHVNWSKFYTFTGIFYFIQPLVFEIFKDELIDYKWLTFANWLIEGGIGLTIGSILKFNNMWQIFPTYKVIGEFEWTEEYILYGHQKIILDKNTELELHINGFKGDNITGMIKEEANSGTENYLTIVCPALKEPLKLRFMLESGYQEMVFKRLLKQLYKNEDLYIKEYYKSKRSYILDSKLSYKKIQELKERFGVKVWA